MRNFASLFKENTLIILHNMKRIVLVRHGESVWNQENRFTGWTDVDLSPKGVNEAIEAGKLLA